jgi:hypothetical protein
MPEIESLPPPTLPPVSNEPAIPASQIAPGATPAPIKKGSARERLSESLSKIAKGPPMPEAPKAADKAPEPKPGEKPAAETPDPKPGEKPAAAAPEKDSKGKVNPWKLVDEYKAKTGKLESELVEAGKRAIPKEKWDSMQGELETTRKRNEELEKHIAFTSYEKSKEFQDKYVAPYQAAWKRAGDDLKELTVDDGSGNPRPFSPQDILELVNLSLPKAREAAVQKFGEFADDVMAHRKEIRRLFDEQSTALSEAQKNSLETQKKQQEQWTKQQGETHTAVKETWEKANKSAMEDPNVGRFLKPIEGDSEWNTRLEKATKLADQAFGENALNPNLSPEQRQDVIERHAAIRNRSIAYSMLRHENSKLTAKTAALEEELKQFKSSEPGRAGAVPQKPNGELKGFARIRAGLEKIAK